MSNFEMHKFLAPFSFEEIVQEVGLRIRGLEKLQKDDLLGKVSGIGFLGNREYRIEFKKYHDLRYGNVLPSMLESYVCSFLPRDLRDSIPVLLIARVKKLSESFLDNALQFFTRYEGKDFNWIMIDDHGRLVGNVQGRIIDQMIRLKSKNKIQPRKPDFKQKLSFSPLQQWLLKCLLLNGVDGEMGEHFQKKMWPFKPHRKIQNYKVLSEISGVSASSCYNLIKLLQDHQYLYIDAFGYRFKNLRRLFDMWEISYLSARKEEVYLCPIKPIESIESWRKKAFHMFGEVSLKFQKEFKVVMSGHLACREIDLSWSNNKSVIFHADGKNNEILETFVKRMKLRTSESAEDGIRIILHKNDYPVLKIAEGQPDVNIADPIQLLLDVLYMGGRGKEQAEYIYEKLLMKHFRRQKWMS